MDNKPHTATDGGQLKGQGHEQKGEGHSAPQFCQMVSRETADGDDGESDDERMIIDEEGKKEGRKMLSMTQNKFEITNCLLAVKTA